MVGGALLCGILIAQPAVILDAYISRTQSVECHVIVGFCVSSLAYFHYVLRITVGNCP